jgi:GMP synthase (glutamine-hydrolysing)
MPTIAKDQRMLERGATVPKGTELGRGDNHVHPGSVSRGAVREGSEQYQSIGIVDLGGQYCHLISRRLRDLGVWSDIISTVDATPEKLSHYAGVILSGGPRSVYEEQPLTVAGILEVKVPLLGICYGHQLLARELGATVAVGNGEYGTTRLQLRTADSLFVDTPSRQVVWMSHSDSVSRLPENVIVLAETERCEIAAFADLKRKIFGVQFHPEVTHTKHGGRVLENFVFRICKVLREENIENHVDRLVARIRQHVGSKSVFFLVSGGVDSTVAFALCAKALRPDQLRGVYVDTGLMRKQETEELVAFLKAFGLGDRFEIRREQNRFLSALDGVIDPEEKRHVIGRLFVEVQSEALREYGIDDRHWLLGQGTIYPDTIESGGSTGTAALIKTHHNRCAEIRKLIQSGLVIEPLADFYKDEVRQIGKALGLDARITQRWPFPGPGLAIRCLCTGSSALKEPTVYEPAALGEGYQALALPLRSVGVQGDGRTYRDVVAINGALNYRALQRLSSRLCNTGKAHNRVIFRLAGKWSPGNSQVLPNRTLTIDRLSLLREADFIVREQMEKHGLVDTVWQFPVVLIPLSCGGGESIVFRPVNSVDGMTANFARVRAPVLHEMAKEVLKLPGIDAVFLDISDKPPATIEWE